MKNKAILTLILMPALLASCNKTKELYPDHAYDTGKFETNYYLEHNNVDKLKTVVKEHDPVEQSRIYISNPSYGGDIAGLGENQYATIDGKRVKLEWNIDTPSDDYGKGYGPTKNLSSISDSFKPGFLSRLYDGRVRCDGYFAQSRVQINKTGYSTFFPKELVTAKYFALAVRGQTSCEGFDYSTSSINFTLTFYKHISGTEQYEANKVHINNVNVPTNTHGNTSLLVVYFDTMFGNEDYNKIMEGTVAMSLTFEMNSITPKDPRDFVKYGVPVDDRTDPNNPHLSMMLYELLLPDSTWK